MDIKEDIFNREQYIEFLEKLINNSNEFRRDKYEKGSFVVALDKPWGTGKTFFINKWIEKSKGNFIFIKYNAWQNDFWNNAFEPLVQSFLVKQIIAAERISKKTIKILLNITAKIGAELAKGVAIKVAKKFINDKQVDTLIENAKKSKDIVEKGSKDLFDSENFSAFLQFKNQIEKFKECIRELIPSDKSKKVIIIIDELDRCRPQFAIQTLEIVKHIFDIEELTFLFSVDLEQLGKSIKTSYGEMDTNGYLFRFFDYITRLPRPPRREFIDHQFADFNFDKKHEQNKHIIIDWFDNLCGIQPMSLRDQQMFFNNFKIVYFMKLRMYSDYAAVKIYMSMIYLKVIHFDFYSDLGKKKVKGQADMPRSINNAYEKFNISGVRFLEMMIENIKIKDYFRVLRNNESYSFVNVVDDNLIFQNDKGKEIELPYGKSKSDITDIEIIKFPEYLIYDEDIFSNGVLLSQKLIKLTNRTPFDYLNNEIELASGVSD